MITIEANKLSIGYSQPIYKDLNLKAEKNELVTLIGPNGIGKTTILKTLGNIISALSGEFKINGREISSFSTKDFANEMGLVLTGEFPSNTLVEDFIGLGRLPKTNFFGKLKPMDYSVIESSMQLTGCAQFAKKKLHELSDGQRQRVTIARILAQETPIMLLDEPTAFLDYPSKIEVLKLLKKLCREQEKTILFSCHDVDLAIEYADNLWCFLKDEIVSGTVDALNEKNVLSNLFKELGFNKEERRFVPY